MPDRHVPSDGTNSDERIGAGAAADLLGVHIDTIRRWADSGYLPSTRHGPAGYRRFRRSDVEAVQAKHQADATPPTASTG